MPYAPVTIKTDAGRGVLTVLAERQSEFPGVTQQPVSIRAYPYGEMAAQVLGYVGQVSEAGAEAARLPRRQAGHGRRPGRARVLLRPLPARRRRASSASRSTPPATRSPSKLAPTPPKAGYSLQGDARPGAAEGGRKGAAARGSNTRAPAANRPTPGRSWRSTRATARCSRSAPRRRFDPNKFAKPLTKSEYAALEGKASASGEASPAPLTDRAVNGTYPTGSTFKPITAMGALEAGVINPSAGPRRGPVHLRLDRSSSATPARPTTAPVGLVEALKVSSDTYFFEVGELANSHGNVIQRKAHKLGIGEQTGIDLPSEITGLVPDRAWRAKVAQRGARAASGASTSRAAASPTGARGASATTCTSPSARATC